MENEGWSSASEVGHPIAQIDGQLLGDYSLGVFIGPKTRYGADYFKVLLRNNEGEASDFTVLALFHSGPYPGHNWIEIVKLTPNTQISGHDASLSKTDIELLFRYLSDMIPPGGHIMVEYESELWADTRNALGCGIPPVLTHLGFLMFKAGCGTAFKDWYFAEGGSEGPRKLQGYKALNEEHRIARAIDMSIELQVFISKQVPNHCQQLWNEAVERAKEILPILSDTNS